jgi:hypothetical protein
VFCPQGGENEEYFVSGISHDAQQVKKFEKIFIDILRVNKDKHLLTLFTNVFSLPNKPTLV